MKNASSALLGEVKRASERLARFVAIGVLLLACNRGDASRLPAQDDQPDQPSNASIRVEQTRVRGTVEGGRLSVEIPITAQRSGRGSLRVYVGSVDGKRVHDQQHVAYQVENKGEAKKLRTELELPDFAQQYELTGYNLFIQDDTELRIRRSLLHVLTPYEVVLEGPGTVIDEKAASYRVLARDPVTKAPLAERRVALVVENDAGVVETYEAETEADGNAHFQITLPGIGEYQVGARVESETTVEQVAEGVEVAPRDNKLLLTTDKPVYKPGQTLHPARIGSSARR